MSSVEKNSLLDLPNCLILQLMSYLDATSLYLLSRTCTRLDELMKGHTSLWRYVDARRAPNDQAKVGYCVDRSHDDTKVFLICADNHLETLVPEDFFVRMCSLKNLTILAIENQRINGERFTMNCFPENISELSLKKSVVSNSMEFFRHSGDHMKNLRVLILECCNWVTSSAFMPISKYKNLEILSVYKCKNIDNSIPYLSLSGQYGFKQLKIFDARLSPVGNTLLRSLYKSESLIAIYLQNEDISYKLDYYKRKLQIYKGSPTRDYYIEDNEFDLNDPLTNEENGFNYEDPTSLDSKGLLDYITTKSAKTETKLPKSFLYLDPYNHCTCGYEERHINKKRKPNSRRKPSADSSSDDSDNDDQGGDGDLISHQIEDKITKLTKIIRQSQTNNGCSRGLTNHNHPRSPPNVLNGNVNAFEEMEDGRPPFMFQNLSSKEMFTDEFVHGRRTIYDYAPPRCRVIEVHLNTSEERKRYLDDNEQTTETKKAKTDEPTPGPSGMNVLPEDSEDSESEDQDFGIQAERPPTPHPDVVVNNPPFFRDDWICVRYEHAADMGRESLIPLRRLSLRGYKKITDLALRYILNVDLELLDLTYTNVTVEGINNYLVEHPSCRIVHEKFCVCPINLHF